MNSPTGNIFFGVMILLLSACSDANVSGEQVTLDSTRPLSPNVGDAQSRDHAMDKGPFTPDASDLGPPSNEPADMMLTPESNRPFKSFGVHDINADGHTGLISIQRAMSGSSLTIRVRTEPPSQVCLQIDSVTDDANNVLVPEQQPNAFGPFCEACTHRVWVSRGYGLFVFPNDGNPLPPSQVVKLRVRLRDCSTLLPTSPEASNLRVVVEAFETRPKATASRRLDLAVVIVEGSRLYGSDAEADPLLSTTLRRVQEIYGEAHINIDLVDLVQAPLTDSDALRFGRNGYEVVDTIVAHARQRLMQSREMDTVLILALTPCLLQEDFRGQASAIDGHAPRIPSGYGVSGFADAILVRDAHCGPDPGTPYWPNADLFGRVIAHEIGHGLGLYHVIETDGTPDHLADTDSPNYMHVSPLSSEATGWSPMQIHVMHHHPFLGETLGE